MYRTIGHVKIAFIFVRNIIRDGFVFSLNAL